MRDDNGMTPLGKIVTIAVVLIILGVSVAMIFGGTDIGSDIKEFIQNTNTSNENVENEKEDSK